MIGLAENVTPDFLYLRRVIGDIKTGEREEFFRVMVAAYAMAYEAFEQGDMNCGIVLNSPHTRALQHRYYAKSYTRTPSFS